MRYLAKGIRATVPPAARRGLPLPRVPVMLDQVEHRNDHRRKGHDDRNDSQDDHCDVPSLSRTPPADSGGCSDSRNNSKGTCANGVCGLSRRSTPSRHSAARRERRIWTRPSARRRALDAALGCAAAAPSRHSAARRSAPFPSFCGPKGAQNLEQASVRRRALDAALGCAAAA